MGEELKVILGWNGSKMVPFLISRRRINCFPIEYQADTVKVAVSLQLSSWPHSGQNSLHMFGQNINAIMLYGVM